MRLEFSWQIFEKYSNIKFHKNPSTGGPSFSTRTDGQTDMTKLIVAIRSFANASKNDVCLGRTLYPSIEQNENPRFF